MSEKVEYHTDSKIRHSCMKREGKQKTAIDLARALANPGAELLSNERHSYYPNIQTLLSHGSFFVLTDQKTTQDGKRISYFDYIDTA